MDLEIHRGSDGGGLLLRELALRTGLFRKLSACFRDGRDSERLRHSVEVLVAALHVGWLLAILAMVDRATPASPVLVGVFVALQIARLWVMATLGHMWTTRVIGVPGASRIVTGPYRFGRHPVYIVAALEIAVVPLMFGEWELALVVTALKLLLLRTRIRIENHVLAEVYRD